MRTVWLEPPTDQLWAVTTHFCSLAARVLELPASAQFTLRKLDSGWGNTVLGGRFSGTVVLHSELTPHEAVLILSHELIHLNQMHRGDLCGTATGAITWRGTVYTDTASLDYGSYLELPWEEEAHRQQEWLLREVLALEAQNMKTVQTNT